MCFCARCSSMNQFVLRLVFIVWLSICFSVILYPYLSLFPYLSTATLPWIVLVVLVAGSQLHKDPDHTGAWNLLLTGRKWWAVLPYRVSRDVDPDTDGSGFFLPVLKQRCWFNHYFRLSDRMYRNSYDISLIPKFVPKCDAVSTTISFCLTVCTEILMRSL